MAFQNCYFCCIEVCHPFERRCQCEVMEVDMERNKTGIGSVLGYKFSINFRNHKNKLCLISLTTNPCRKGNLLIAPNSPHVCFHGTTGTQVWPYGIKVSGIREQKPIMRLYSFPLWISNLFCRHITENSYIDKTRNWLRFSSYGLIF